ncbi:MAG: NAD-dependent epimerase/dehydratase family protein, partial [Planctomycetota bacterium]
RSDLCASLERLESLAPFDEVYHLAAAVGVDLVMREPVRAIETNIEQTASFLRFLPRLGRDGRSPSLLLTSSSEVYGKPTRRVFSEEDDVVYGPTTVRRWSYAYAKAIDEYLVLGHAEASGSRAVVVRLFNTVGPGQVGSYGMVLPRFVESALRGEPLTVHGDGTQTRCFCDVRDVAEALRRLLACEACHGRVFNVGSDRPITIRELAERVVEVTGSSSPIRLVPYGDVYPSGFEDLKHRRPDLSRIREAIGFEPKFDLSRTIADLAEEIGDVAGSAREGSAG